MTSTPFGTYTAKLTNGPLEGKTVTTEFLDSGDPRPRIEIPATSGDKRYLYARGAGLEYGREGDNSDLPSAVDYHFIETTVGAGEGETTPA